MEFLTIFLVTLISASLCFFFHFYVSKHIRPETRSSAAPLPPGKLGLPLLGESLDFVSNIMKSTPEKFIWDRIKRHESSTFKTSLLGEPMVVMYGTAGNKFVFANEGKLVGTWWPKTIDSLFSSSNLKEFRIKTLAHSFLKPDCLQKYVGIMDGMARAHVQDKWHGQKEVNVYPMAKEYTFKLACRLFLSTEDADFIATLTVPMTKLTAGFFSIPINLPWTRFGRAVRASKFIMTRLRAVIRKRRQELLLAVEKDLNYKSIGSNQDILSHMLLSSEKGTYMNDTEIAVRIMGILAAGYDTPSVTIGILFKYLGEDPELYHKVFQEQMEISRNKGDGELLNWQDILKMKHSWNVALEAMRIYPPLQAVFREAISDFTYSGYHIPKGCKLHVNIHSTHRDPKYFPDPEKFDPSRFEEGGPLPYTFIPFGGGLGMCPGRSYAQMEILVFLHNIVKRFKWENILHDEVIVFGPSPRPAKGLPVRLHPHEP